MSAYISVIIPLYNKAEFIAGTIESVINQSFKNYEVIIINDGSTDNSLEIAKAYSSDKISIYSTENKGVSHARNYGVSKAKADLIAFLDADDLWLTNHLEDLYKLYKSYPDCGLYANNYDKVFFNSAVVKTVFNGIPNNFHGIIDDYFKASTIDCIAWTSAVAIPKSVFKNLKGFNTTLNSAEDTDLWIRIALKYNVAFSSKVTAIKNIHNLNNHLSLNMKATDGLTLVNQFTSIEKENASLKKYLDLNRFSFAIERKMGNDMNSFKNLKSNIDTKNLNYKQLIILRLPRLVLKQLMRLKYILIKKRLYISPFK